MNIAFISFSFFIQNSQVWFINTIEKKTPVYVYFMREIFEDENKTLKNFFSKTKNRSNVHVVFSVRKY